MMMRTTMVLTMVALLGCNQNEATVSSSDVGADVGSSDMSVPPRDGDVDQGRDLVQPDVSPIDASLPDVCCEDEPPLRVETLEQLEGELLNPERGFYEPVSLMDQTDFDYVREAGQTVIYSYVMLDDFRDQALTAAFLSDMEVALDRVRAAELKIIVRFAYNLGPYPDSEPDAPLGQVLEHISQVTPVLERHRDVIMLVQGGFIGAWGEWHTSTNDLTTPENRETILRALLDAVPPERAVQIRYPSAKVDIFGSDPLTEREAFSGTPAARVGHHNDCFLASDNDLGTYGRGDATMAEELAYLEEETRFVPMGGETCAVNPPRSECATALSELERLHFSYLNLGYHGDVIDGWRDGGCFDEMRDRLGYRLAVTQLAHSECVRPGGRLAVRLEIENSGYAAPFNSRPVRLVLRNADTALVASLNGADLRTFGPGIHALESVLRVPVDIVEGEWELALWLPDADENLEGNPAYAIRLANADAWDAASGYNLLGTQCVDSKTPGEFQPDAREFMEL